MVPSGRLLLFTMDPFGRRLPLVVVVAMLLVLVLLPQADEVEAGRYHKYRPVPAHTLLSPRSPPAVTWCDCELCNQTLAPEELLTAAEASWAMATTAALPSPPEVEGATRPRINRPPKTPKRPSSPRSPAVLWCDCAVCNDRTFAAESLVAAESWTPTTAAAVPSQLGGSSESLTSVFHFLIYVI